MKNCRWAYNETLAYRKRAYEDNKRISNWYETKQLLPTRKDQRERLKLIHSQVLQNVTQRVDLAFQAFFRRVREGAEEVGFPRSRAKDATTASPIPNTATECGSMATA